LPKSSTPRARQPADADAGDLPAARAEAFDARAQRLAGLGGAQDVVALEQPLDRRLADGEEAEDQRAVRNRLVAGPGRQRRYQAVPPSVPGGCIMRWFYILIFVLLVAAIAIFAIQNLQTVIVRFLNFAIEAPMALVVIGVYVLGMITGSSLLAALRRSWEHARRHH
jgi:lipopolysaccharide assembly protein A